MHWSDKLFEEIEKVPPAGFQRTNYAQFVHNVVLAMQNEVTRQDVSKLETFLTNHLSDYKSKHHSVINSATYDEHVDSIRELIAKMRRINY
jgi:transcriptional regulator of heat shock response